MVWEELGSRQEDWLVNREKKFWGNNGGNFSMKPSWYEPKLSKSSSVFKYPIMKIELGHGSSLGEKIDSRSDKSSPICSNKFLQNARFIYRYNIYMQSLLSAFSS